jgi:DNA-binding GntR family transcriptional regulator
MNNGRQAPRKDGETVDPTFPAAGPLGLKHASLASSAADWITNRIIEGGISPGEKVTEIGLAEQMGISRSPVREALRALSREGLITIEPRRGAFVVELDRDQAAELYTCRLLVEPACIGLSVKVITDDRQSSLDTTFVTMKRAVAERDAAAYVSALKDYNWTLLDGCPNRMLFGYAESTWRSSLRYWDLMVRGSSNYLTQSLRRNRAVHNAVRAHDPAEAQKVSVIVLERGRDELLKLLSKLPAARAGKP